jgi:D-alanyl-D-alanine carboxypeptidase
MIRFLLLMVFLLLITSSQQLRAQSPDSIFFNLYTDSLKKGAWNYINVEGRITHGKIVPLSARSIVLKASTGKVEDMSVWLDWNTTADTVVVEVSLKTNPAVTAKTIIWIKKYDPQLDVQQTDSLLQQLNERNRRKPKEKRSKQRLTGTSWHLPGTWPVPDQSMGVSAVPGWNPADRYTHRPQGKLLQ